MAAKPRRPDSSQETKRLTLEALTTVKLPTQELEIPMLGGAVLLQGFSGRITREVREIANHNPGTDKKCTFCKVDWPCAQAGQPDDEVYERMLVKYGVIDPKLDDDAVEVLFDEQFAGVGRMIAVSVLMLNASGKAPDIAKDLGQTMNTDSSSL